MTLASAGISFPVFSSMIGFSQLTIPMVRKISKEKKLSINVFLFIVILFLGCMDAQIRHKARSSPAVGLLRALWTHFASAPFSAPVADFRRGDNYATHYQAVTAAQSQGPGGVGSVGYVEVAGHEYGVVMLGGIWFYSSTPPIAAVMSSTNIERILFFIVFYD
jgi:hypothetical protein